MADDQTDQQSTDDSGSSDNNGVTLNPDQIMQLISQAYASTPPASPYRAAQPPPPLPQQPPAMQQAPPPPQMQPPKPQAPPQQPPTPQPQVNKVVRETSEEPGKQPPNVWQQIYAALQQQNPGASPKQLLYSMKLFKDAGAFDTYSKALEGKKTETTTTTKSGQQGANGKTVEEQLYASLLRQGMTPAQAAQVVQQQRGVSADQVGAKEKAKQEADLGVKKEAAQPKAEQAMYTLEENADDALSIVKTVKGQSGFWTTGLASSLTKSIPGTPAFDLRANIEKLQSRLGLDTLQEIKNSSPNGSALGRVTNYEMGILVKAKENLDQAQSESQFKAALDDLATKVKNSKKHVAEAYKETYGGGSSGGSNSDQGSAPAQSKSVNWNDL